MTVDGKRLVVHCSGSGSPTVVLEAGLGDGSATWSQIQPGVGKVTRVCSYDRLGEGASDKPTGVQTVADQATTLDGLVDAAGWDGPFVFVAHSWGGLIVQRFATDRSDKLAGAVFVDSSSAGQLQKWLKLIPPKPKSGFDPYSSAREMLLQGLNEPQQNPEDVDWKASSSELGGLKALGTTPVVVLTAGTLDLEFPTAASQRRADAIWLGLHDRLARLSTNSVHAIAQYSGHYIYESQPDVVMAALRAVVDDARDEKGLPKCSVLFRDMDGVACRSAR